MKFEDYVNEMDDLDRVEMSMAAINKKLPQMKKMIEKNTRLKVKKIHLGGQEADPMIDLGEYDIQFPDQKTAILKKNFAMVKTGNFMDILRFLENL